MNVVATAKYIHHSPRKVRLVANAVSSMSPVEAVDHLRLLNKRGAQVVIDVLQSAVANATNNFKLEESTLRIKTLEVSDGPRLKRMSPRSRGRATTVLRRMSHVRVILTDEPVVLGKRKAAAELAKQQPRKDRSRAAKTAAAAKTAHKETKE